MKYKVMAVLLAVAVSGCTNSLLAPDPESQVPPPNNPPPVGAAIEGAAK